MVVSPPNTSSCVLCVNVCACECVCMSVIYMHPCMELCARYHPRCGMMGINFLHTKFCDTCVHQCVCIGSTYACIRRACACMRWIQKLQSAMHMEPRHRASGHGVQALDTGTCLCGFVQYVKHKGCRESPTVASATPKGFG